MDFIVGIGVVVVFFFVVSFISRVEAEQAAKFSAESGVKKEKPPKQCPPHDWTYNMDDRLQCCVCQLKAGDVSTDNGSY